MINLPRGVSIEVLLDWPDVLLFNIQQAVYPADTFVVMHAEGDLVSSAMTQDVYSVMTREEVLELLKNAAQASSAFGKITQSDTNLRTAVFVPTEGIFGQRVYYTLTLPQRYGGEGYCLKAFCKETSKLYRCANLSPLLKIMVDEAVEYVRSDQGE